jgi:hypothetical protein
VRIAGWTRALETRFETLADEQLHRIEDGKTLNHRLVRLPGVSRRRRRLLGPIQSHLYDV